MYGVGHQRSHRIRAKSPGIMIWLWLWLLQSIGVSSLAAGHLTLVPQIIAELAKLGREDIIVVVGGVIPAQDYDQLYKDGAAAIFGPGTKIPDAAIKLLEILSE